MPWINFWFNKFYLFDITGRSRNSVLDIRLESVIIAPLICKILQTIFILSLSDVNGTDLINNIFSKKSFYNKRFYRLDFQTIFELLNIIWHAFGHMQHTLSTIGWWYKAVDMIWKKSNPVWSSIGLRHGIFISQYKEEGWTLKIIFKFMSRYILITILGVLSGRG